MRMLLDRFRGDRGGNFALMTAVVTVPLVLGRRPGARRLEHRPHAVGAAAGDRFRRAGRRQRGQGHFRRARRRSRTAVPGRQLRPDAGRHPDQARRHQGHARRQCRRRRWRLAACSATTPGRWRAVASADIAYMSYEIGLVLDTTGSMSGGKLAAMKDAVTGLIDTMSAQVSDKDKLKFGLVPFSTFVNVGPGFGRSSTRPASRSTGTGAAWLDLEGGSSIPQHRVSQGSQPLPGLQQHQPDMARLRRNPTRRRRRGLWHDRRASPTPRSRTRSSCRPSRSTRKTAAAMPTATSRPAPAPST